MLTMVLTATITGCAAYAVTSGRVAVKDSNIVVDIHFTNGDRTLIKNYYKKLRKKKGIPPGLAKRKSLPPGLAKRVKLPPGLQGDPLPAGLERQLSRLPSTYVRLQVGRDIVLMNTRTRVVMDVLYGALK